MTVFVTAWLGALSGTALGLLISAAAESADRAMSLVPYLLITQLVLCGVLFQLGAIGLRLVVHARRWNSVRARRHRRAIRRRAAPDIRPLPALGCRARRRRGWRCCCSPAPGWPPRYGGCAGRDWGWSVGRGCSCWMTRPRSASTWAPRCRWSRRSTARGCLLSCRTLKGRRPRRRSCFSTSGHAVVGAVARESLATEPASVVQLVKRHIGSGWTSTTVASPTGLSTCPR